MLLIIAKILLIVVCIFLSMLMILFTVLSKTISKLMEDLEKKCAELKDQLVFKEKSEILKIVLPWLGVFAFSFFDKYLIFRAKSGVLRVFDNLIGLSAKIQAIIELTKSITKLKDRIKDR